MQQLFWFLVVGGSAAAVHFAVVSALVPLLNMSPLWVNVFGFLVAFGVSYSGHRYLTFQAQAATQRHRDMLPRFFGVAVGSFVLNQCLYATLLRFTALDYRIALAITLVVVAAVTFIVSKLWAFKTAQPTA